MEILLLTMLHGLIIGLLISAPMGPIGALCIQRTLNKGRWAGFSTGVGAALSDIIYCLLTGLGMSFVIDFIEANHNILQVIGSVVLVVFGIYLIRKNPAGQLKTPQNQRYTYTQDLVTGFLLTFSNPLILFLIIGLFAQFNFLQQQTPFYFSVIGFICIFSGAILWWFLITYFVNAVKAHFNVRSLWLVNRIIGLIILVMALIGFVWGLKDYILNINGTQLF